MIDAVTRLRPNLFFDAASKCLLLMLTIPLNCIQDLY